MKKGMYVLIAIIAVLVVIGLAIGGSYNSLVDLSEEVDSKLANIDVQLTRRADLIPNLVNSVKGYMKHESDIIEKVTTARENMVGAKNTEDKLKANDELSSALNALFVIVENYPELKSNENFIQLQDELAGTENRIANSRKEYNEAVTNYNKTIKKFPKNIIAGIFNFKEKTYFEVEDSKKDVPTVDFND